MGVRLRRDPQDGTRVFPLQLLLQEGAFCGDMMGNRVCHGDVHSPVQEPRLEFEEILDRMADKICIRSCGPHPVLLARDLNAKSATVGFLANGYQGRGLEQVGSTNWTA